MHHSLSKLKILDVGLMSKKDFYCMNLALANPHKN